MATTQRIIITWTGALGRMKHWRSSSQDLHQGGIKVILDGVFNHVGRDFWAFRDVQRNGERSSYAHWFHGLNFSLRSPYGDNFGYEGWNGNYDLVKLNLHSPEVKDHLFQAVRQWVYDFDIDGLRLDVADSLDKQFLHELSVSCHGLRPDFWLMGEVVHGDYNAWANPDMLDSVTNYECYKGLYSSLVDKNYFEIAYSLKRQFGPSGLYRDLKLYNFVDNHDVDRVASSLKNAKHLYPLYCLLFTMPGIPSVYYGSEWGLQARRTSKDDRALRPCLDLKALLANSPQPELPDAIAHLARVRLGTDALRYGDYNELFVAPEQFAFSRNMDRETVIVLLNAASTDVSLDIPVLLPQGSLLMDLLNPDDEYRVDGNRLHVDNVRACWGRILQVRK